MYPSRSSLDMSSLGMSSLGMSSLDMDSAADAVSRVALPQRPFSLIHLTFGGRWANASDKATDRNDGDHVG